METNEKVGKGKFKFNSSAVDAEVVPADSVCTLCGQPATQLVDGEPSCAAHVEQIYEHQVEDYTRQHLTNNEWRDV